MYSWRVLISVIPVWGMKPNELFIKSQDFLTRTVDTHSQYRGLQITMDVGGELKHHKANTHGNAFKTGFMISVSIFFDSLGFVLHCEARAWIVFL